MKKFKAIAFASATLALTGCFAEDYGFCPPEELNNVTLHFRLPEAKRAGDAFLDKITSSVVTAVFNEDGSLVEQIVTTEIDHRKFQGVKTRLVPGVYRVVCWGNSGTNTEHRNLARHYYDDGLYAHTMYRSIGEGRRVGHADELYYAPNTVSTRIGTGAGNAGGEYVMTVDEQGHEGTLDFRHAHRRVEIYVKNFNDGEGGTNPAVRLSGLPHGLTSVGMKHIPVAEGGEAVTAEISGETVSAGKDGEEGYFSLAVFNTFHFQLDGRDGGEDDADFDDITVDIVNPRTGEAVATVEMNDHIDDDRDTSLPLKLLVEFLGDTEVRVTIPNWNSADVDYGLSRTQR